MGAFALAFVAGVVSFSSPCCLPLMPGYVSYVSGVAGTDRGAVAVRSRVVGAALLFVLGFSAVFTSLGAAVTTIGSSLLHHRTGLIQVAGLVVIIMGMVTMGLVRIPFLMRERRFDLHRIAPGPGGAFPLGMAFAMGWTPCIGPVLAGILTAAGSTGAPMWGAALLFAYSLGLGLPFILLALGVTRSDRIAGWLQRHGRGVEVLGGALLVAMGILMLTGAWLRLFTPILRVFSRSGWPPI